MAELSLNLLNRSNKSELIEWYKEHFKTDPDENMSKAQLVNALAEKLGLVEGSGGDNSNLNVSSGNTQTVSGDKVERPVPDEHEILLERISPVDGQIEYLTTPKAAFEQLAPGYGGWKLAKPEEIA